MSKYQLKETIEAFKIKEIEGLELKVIGQKKPITVDHLWIAQNEPKVGGYIVMGRIPTYRSAPGFEEQFEKSVVSNGDGSIDLSGLKEAIASQCEDGVWDNNPEYFGLANGLIGAEAILEGKTPVYLDAPEKWGVTSEELLQSTDDESIARIAHGRWVNHMVNQGWKFGKKKSIKNLIHPLLVDYDNLPDEEKVLFNKR